MGPGIYLPWRQPKIPSDNNNNNNNTYYNYYYYYYCDSFDQNVNLLPVLLVQTYLGTQTLELLIPPTFY